MAVRLSAILLMVCFTARAVYAMDNTSGLMDLDQSVYPEWLAPPAYSYSPQGIADPFVPFVQPPVQEERQEPAIPQRPLTPLERIDVRQLNLVGVLWASAPLHEPAAMVELPDGKGFILRKGTVVGRHQGQVIEVLPDQVVVLEKVANIFGVTEERRTTLKLRPGKED